MLCDVPAVTYWGLRDYGHAGQIGLESTPDAFVEALVSVFQEVRRVLKADGTCWLNLGDSYASSGVAGEAGATSIFRNTTRPDGGGASLKKQGAQGNGRAPTTAGLKAKDLCGIPWRVAFALQADGWYLRSDIIWSKPNPMPESVTDRPTKAHEYIFLLAKSQRYYYDAEAILEPYLSMPTVSSATVVAPKGTATPHGGPCGRGGSHSTTDHYSRAGRNARSVWTITTFPYPDAHFATFPPELPTRCILAGSKPGDLILDPFTGSGTTGQVALALGRSFVGVELNPQYAELARKRIGGSAPLFSEEQTA